MRGQSEDERRFPLLIGIGAFRLLAVVPAWLLFTAAVSQTLYLAGPDVPHGEALRIAGDLGLVLALCLCVSPFAVFLALRAIVRVIRRAVAARACDAWLSRGGLRVQGGRAGGLAATWADLARPGSVEVIEEGLRLRTLDGDEKLVPAPRDAEERASLQALAATVAAHAAAATSLAGRAPAKREPPGTVHCAGCGAAQAPADAPSVRCPHCGVESPVAPELAAKIRSLKDVAAARAREDRLIAALLRQPGAWLANTVAFVGGLLCMGASVITILMTAAFAFIDGKEAGLPRLGGMGLVEAGVCLILLAAVRRLLVDRRALRVLTLGLAAAEPAHEGDPPACRVCSGPLPAPAAGASVTRCAYCGSTNVLAADMRLEASILARFGGASQDPSAIVAECARGRRRALVLAAAGAAATLAGGAWIYLSAPPRLDERGAAAIPYVNEVSKKVLGVVEAGPGAASVERAATVGDVQAVLLPDGRGGVDAVTLGERARLLRSPSGRADPGAPPPRDLPDGWPWARASSGALVFASDGVVRRLDEGGAARALYGDGLFDDPLLEDLAPGPGGGVLATTRASEHGHLRVRLLAEDGSSRVLFDDAREPALHPDGRRAAIARLIKEELFQIVVADLEDRSSERMLTRGDGHAALPAWSPDGQRVAFLTWSVRDHNQYSVRRGEVHLWVVDLEGRAARLTQGVNLSRVRPVWTEQGIYVVARERDRSKVSTVIWRVVPR